ncbi:DUF805 domain-containing protein [Pseudomonas fragi]|uniref:DUF805 domain-containing protein n=1 Tax=Pseudomonas fragi TaxID=296 RepID=UPI001475285A|nr:DUF805 domain-containing protein [Pseudomonas fragi]NNB60128.1 DUF805 domain-containing protein [Pseudomonas fragi]
MPELSLDKTPQEQYAALDPVGFSGRIGRLRLLAWSMVISIIAAVTSLLVLLAVKVSPTLGMTCGATLTLAYFIVSLRIGAQRLHDLNWSAWMLLLHLVPVANLVLTLLMLLMPGTPGPNKYGPPPPPNSRAVNVLAAITIFLIGLGICAMAALLALGLMTAVINAVNGNSL